MTVRIELGESSYDVVLEPGCLSHAGELLDLDRKVLVVTDAGVPEEYAEKVAAQCKERISTDRSSSKPICRSTDVGSEFQDAA